LTQTSKTLFDRSSPTDAAFGDDVGAGMIVDHD